jgi:3-phenylpropionate/trans-cinnamate dioxygenase ferredoxin reductase component
MTLDDVVVVGGSTAGSTFMRELRRRGFDKRLTLIDPERGTNRPPLSKAVLAGQVPDSSVLLDHSASDATHIRSRATTIDPATRRVTTAGGAVVPYDALVIACGSSARRLLPATRRGEMVLRTLNDAQRLRSRFAVSTSAVVIGGGFLGMEVATAAIRSGLVVTVVDPEPPLRRLLGDHLAADLVEQATSMGIQFRQSTARLLGDPVTCVQLDDGGVLEADVVVSCVGDIPETDWLAGSGLVTRHGIEIDSSTRTAVAGVFAIGDVAAVRSGDVVRRAPYWANAVTQARVAAAAVLGHEIDDPIVDEYFWTDVAGVSLKAVGNLPVVGSPRCLEDGGDGRGLFAWEPATVVALGVRRSVPKLREAARRLSGLVESSAPMLQSAARRTDRALDP